MPRARCLKLLVSWSSTGSIAFPSSATASSWESSVAPISSARSLVPTATFGKSFRTTSSDGLLWLDPDELDIDVSGGVVRIGGTVEWRTVAQLVEAFAWRIPGVVSVDCSELRWRTDDRKQRTAVVSQ